MRVMKLFRQFCIMSLKSLMEYKADFLIGIFPVLLNQLVGLLFLKIVFDNIHTLTGNGFFECVMIYGFYSTAASIEKLFFGNFPRLKGYVFGGEFDLILMKPTHPILYMVLMDFDGIHLIQTIISIVILVYSVCKMDIVMSMTNILFIVIAVFLGAVFLAALTIFTTSIFFYTEGTFSLFNMVEILKSYARYPISIFGKGMMFVFQWIFPLGIVSYFPTQLVLQKNGSDMALYLVLAGGIVSLLFLLANTFFTYSMKKYQSAGG